VFNKLSIIIGGPQGAGLLKIRLRKIFKELGIDGSIKSLVRYISEDKKIHSVPLNYSEIINEAAKKLVLPASQAARYVSSIIIGAVSGLTNVKKKAIEYSLARRLKSLGYS
jgi:2-oxoglutarate ferredoxin oxidoreductase subunit alpha